MQSWVKMDFHSISSLGLATLQIRTCPHAHDYMQAFAAGYFEGYVT